MAETTISQFPDLGGDLTSCIISSAIEVHKELGPGLLESVYEECFFRELQDRGLEVLKQVALPVVYKGDSIDQGFRLDLLVEDRVVVELKSCENILPIHRAQIMTYMRLSKKPIGLLINFNKKVLKDGVQRFALSQYD